MFGFRSWYVLVTRNLRECWLKPTPTDLSELVYYVYFLQYPRIVCVQNFISVRLDMKHKMYYNCIMMKKFILLTTVFTYVHLSLHKSHITSPENCLFWVLYLRFNGFQIKSLARNKNYIMYVYRNELLCVDNYEDGCKLIILKHWQPLANVNGVISGKSVISLAHLWENQSCTSNYKTCCISVSRLLYNSVCLMYKHVLLPTIFKVFAPSASHTHSVDVYTGPGLALIHLADTTLP